MMGEEEISLAEIWHKALIRIHRNHSDLTAMWNRFRVCLTGVETIHDLQAVVLGPRKACWKELNIPLRLKVVIRQVLLEELPLPFVPLEQDLTPQARARRLSALAQESESSHEVPLTRKRRSKLSWQNCDVAPIFAQSIAVSCENRALEKPSLGGSQAEHICSPPPESAASTPNPYKSEVLTSPPSFLRSIPVKPDFTPGSEASQSFTHVDFNSLSPSAPELTPSMFEGLAISPSFRQKGAEITPSNSPFAPLPRKQISGNSNLLSEEREQQNMFHLQRLADTNKEESGSVGVPQYIQDSVPSVPAQFLQENKYDSSSSSDSYSDSSEYETDSSEEEERGNVPPEAWVCPSCTLENISNASCCVACRNPRPLDSPRSPSSTYSDGESKSKGHQKSLVGKMIPTMKFKRPKKLKKKKKKKDEDQDGEKSEKKKSRLLSKLKRKKMKKEGAEQKNEENSSNIEQEQEIESSANSSTWVCPTCTLENAGGQTCSACCNPKPTCEDSDWKDLAFASSQKKPDQPDEVSEEEMVEQKKTGKKIVKMFGKIRKPGKVDTSLPVKSSSALAEHGENTTDSTKSDGLVEEVENDSSPDKHFLNKLLPQPVVAKTPPNSNPFLAKLLTRQAGSVPPIPPIRDNFRHPPETKSSTPKNGLAPSEIFQPIKELPDSSENENGTSAVYTPDPYSQELTASVQEPLAGQPGSIERPISAVLVRDSSASFNTDPAAPIVFAVAVGDKKEEETIDKARQQYESEHPVAQKKGKFQKMIAAVKGTGAKKQKTREDTEELAENGDCKIESQGICQEGWTGSQIPPGKSGIPRPLRSPPPKPPPNKPSSNQSPQDAPLVSSEKNSRPRYWSNTPGLVEIELSYTEAIIGERPSGNTLSVDYLLNRFETLPTLSRGSVLKVYRNQNEPLWEEYVKQKVEIQSRNSTNANEKLLFYGNSASEVEGILQNGFGIQHIAEDSLGAIYLSKNADAAHALCVKGGPVNFHEREATRENQLWANTTQVYKMLFCRVITGNTATGDQAAYGLPPPGEELLYDSVAITNNSGGKLKQTAVFDFQHIFPEFLILYKCG